MLSSCGRSVRGIKGEVVPKLRQRGYNVGEFRVSRPSACYSKRLLRPPRESGLRKENADFRAIVQDLLEFQSGEHNVLRRPPEEWDEILVASQKGD